MLTVTIDQSEGISGADIPEQAVKKMRTGSVALSLSSPRAFFALNDFPPLSRSLEQAILGRPVRRRLKSPSGVKDGKSLSTSYSLLVAEISCSEPSGAHG